MNITDITKQIRALADQLESTQTSAPVDPYAELKAAHAAGKVIEYRDAGSQWMWVECKRPIWYKTAEYRIKPDAPPFQLPPPPPGMQWHRTDGWKAEDLPPGTRPHVLGEEDYPEDSELRADGWRSCIRQKYGTTDKDFHRRTTRPLVFQHAGKSWTYHRPGDPMPCDGEALIEIIGITGKTTTDDGRMSLVARSARSNIWNRTLGWRYAEPLTREVELGPEDVPPLSVIRRKGEEQNWHWRLLSYVHGTHAICADRGYTWSELARDYEINRPCHRDSSGNPTLWEPCHKTIPQNG